MKQTVKCQKRFSKTEEVFQNPYIGFTSFQHFRDEPLFSDCANNMGWSKEHYPVYDWVEQDGRAQGFYPNTEVAYIRILWKDFEPAEGVFDYTLTDEIFRKAAEKKQSVMLRLMPHTTRENEDVPDWLREQIPCPARPATERVKDSPADPLYLEKFSRAVEALGKRYDGLPQFYAMDISLTGAWGEGHGFKNYPEETLQALMDTFVRAFPKTHLLGQICAPALVNYAAQKHPMGFRADGLGEPGHMNDMFPRHIFQMRDAWKTAPVSFESFWQFTEWNRQGWDIDDIIEQTLKWHISSINAKSSPIPWEWKEKIDGWLKKMGYRFAVRMIEYPREAAAGDTISLLFWIENLGVAPIYNKLPFTLRLENERTKTVFETAVDARNWMPGDTIENFAITLPENLPQGTYSLSCRLGGGELPIVRFATDTPCSEDGFYFLTDICIEA